MDALIYLGKVNLYWILLYACYHLVLRRHTFFELNRGYLLVSLLLAFALPLIIYPATAPPLPVIYEVRSEAFTISYAPVENPSLFTWTNLAWMVYALGISIGSFQLLRHIFRLRRFLNSGELIVLDDCNVVLIDSNQVGSFSFWKWIVINRSDYEQHFDAILRHEMVHTRQWHSVDIMFLEILKIVFWFNPVLLLYKHAVQEVHEFLADSQAPNRENYAKFLVAYALHAPVASLTNHFFKPSQIKTRIVMIYKNRTSKWLLGTYVITLTVIGLIAMFVAGCENSDKPDDRHIADTGENILIQGEVKDVDGHRIPGAEVEVKGIEMGTSTDSEGRFRLNVPGNAELVITFPGHNTQIIKVKKNSNIDIILGQGKNSGAFSFKKQEPKVISPPEIIDGKDVFMVVEEQPLFPGGVEEMYKFVGKNLKYPTAAVKAHVSGTVFLSFIVKEDGTIADVKVMKGLGFGMDDEAIRVLRAFPKWLPGKQDGKPVKVRFYLPIKFAIEG